MRKLPTTAGFAKDGLRFILQWSQAKVGLFLKDKKSMILMFLYSYIWNKTALKKI